MHGPPPATALRARLALAAGIAIGLACASAPATLPEPQTPDEAILPQHVIPSGRDAERTADGLVRVRAPNTKALVYAKPPRPNLQNYDRMYVNPPQIRYKKGVRGWASHEEAELLDYFRRVFVEELKGRGVWEIVDEPAPGVLFTRISLLEVDIEATQGATTANTTFAAAGGGAILVLEFFDSATAEPLFRYVEKRRLPGGVYSGAGVDQYRLKSVVREFAGNLSQFVETSFRFVREVERRERQGGAAAPEAPAPD